MQRYLYKLLFTCVRRLRVHCKEWTKNDINQSKKPFKKLDSFYQPKIKMNRDSKYPQKSVWLGVVVWLKSYFYLCGRQLTKSLGFSRTKARYLVLSTKLLLEMAAMQWFIKGLKLDLIIKVISRSKSIIIYIDRVPYLYS